MKKLYFLFALIVGMMTATTLYAKTVSGKCGDNLNWSLDTETETLTISGSGPMYDFETKDSKSTAPWYEYKNSIRKVDMTGGTTVGNDAFIWCLTLEEVTLVNTLTSIGNSAFFNTNLKTVPIGDRMRNLTHIGTAAFGGCPYITEVYIPATLTSLGSDPFERDKSLIKIVVNKNNPNYTSVDGVLYSKDMKTLISYPNGNGEKTFVVPEGVEEIGAGCMREVTITELTLPSSLKTMQKLAVESEHITSIISLATTPPTWETSWSMYFYKQPLTILVPYGCINKYTSAYGWSQLADKISQMDPEAEGKCGDNATWAFNQSTGELSIDGTGDMYDYYFKTAPWTYLADDITSISFLGSITSVGNWAFSNLTKVTTVSLGGSITRIGTAAFHYCESLTSISLGIELETIGDDAFWGCEQLSSGLNIYSNVWNIGNSTFGACYSIPYFYVSDDNPNFKGYRDAIYSKNMEVLMAYPMGKTDEELVIPQGVKRIANTAIYGSHHIKRVTLPATLTTIAENNFIYMNIMEEVTSYAVVPPDCLSEHNFYEISNAVLYVPAESVEAYRAADGWKNFGTIEEINNADGIVEIIANDNNCSATTRKIVSDGTLYILRPNGTIFNAQGAQVR